VHPVGFIIRILSNLSPLQGTLVLRNTVFQIFCIKNSVTVWKNIYVYVHMHADTYAACLCIIPTKCNLVLLRPHVRYSYKIYTIWKINSTSGRWVRVAGKMSIYIQPPARPCHGSDGWLAACGILWQTSGLNPRPVHVEFLVDKVSLE
jgi:hypothetical protein